jgi:hypothetical protein
MESEDGRAVGVHRNTGERNGKRLDVLCCIVFDIKNGKVIDLGLASRVISGGTRDCPGGPARMGQLRGATCSLGRDQRPLPTLTRPFSALS